MQFLHFPKQFFIYFLSGVWKTRALNLNVFMAVQSTPSDRAAVSVFAPGIKSYILPIQTGVCYFVRNCRLMSCSPSAFPAAKKQGELETLPAGRLVKQFYSFIFRKVETGVPGMPVTIVKSMLPVPESIQGIIQSHSSSPDPGPLGFSAQNILHREKSILQSPRIFF